MAHVTKSALAQEGPIWFTPPPDRRGRYPQGLWGGVKKVLDPGGLFKSPDPAPAPPDPVATANAQGQANLTAAEKEAELNRTNSVTPFGTNTWSKGADGTWTQTTALGPQWQSLMDQYKSQIGATPGAQTPLDLSGYQGGINSSVSHIMSAPTGIANNSSDIERSKGLATGAGDVLTQLIQQGKDTYGNKLDYSSLGGLPQANEEMRQKVADALYANSASRLDPYWQQQKSDLASSLAAQGIQLGTDAYDRALGGQARDLNDAYSQARNDATTMSTDQMAKLFGMEMARRQQGVGELNYLYNLPMELMGKGQGVYSGLENTLNQDYATNIAQRQADQAIKSSQISDTLGTFGTLADMAAGQHASNASDRAQASGERAQTLEQLMALAGGSQIANNGMVNVAPAPVAQSIYNSYQGNLANNNAAAGAQNQKLQTAGTIAGAVAMAF